MGPAESVGSRRENHHESLGIDIVRRTKQHCVNNAEDGRIRADRKNGDHYRAQRRGPSKSPDRLDEGHDTAYLTLYKRDRHGIYRTVVHPEFRVANDVGGGIARRTHRRSFRSIENGARFAKIAPAMTEFEDREGRIARLLADPVTSGGRPALLEELSAYASLVVREARRLGPLVPSTLERERTLAWLQFPVFICGHHRSGTTLMRDLLDGHPELCVLPSEATYFSSFRYAARRVVAVKDTDRFAADWVQRFINPNFEPHFLLGRAAPGLAGNAVRS